MKQKIDNVSRRNLGSITSATLGSVKGSVETIGLYTPAIRLS